MLGREIGSLSYGLKLEYEYHNAQVMEAFDIRCKSASDCDESSLCIRPSESLE